MSDAPALLPMPELVACVRHQERACPSCYTVPASAEDVAQVLAIAEEAERVIALVLQRRALLVPASARAVRYRVCPPTLRELRTNLSSLAMVLLVGREAGQRLEQLAGELDERLREAGRSRL
jgi:hypothetical protein